MAPVTRFLARKSEDLFSADLRSLAAFRIALGIILLADLALRLPDLAAHYTDAGVMPRSAFVFRWWRFCAHLWGGAAGFEAALFALAAAAAAALIAGYRTRLAACLSWALLLSLHFRNPLVLQGGDILLRLMLFWAMFLPLGSTRFARSPQAGQSPRVLSGATAAYFFQIALVYAFTAAHKSGAEWSGGGAIYYALQLDTMSTPFGSFLLRFPEALGVLTRGIRIFEALVPVLLFFPVFTPAVRLITVIAVAALQAAFGLSFSIGLFPWIASAAMLPFVPSEAWDKLRWTVSGERLASPANRRPLTANLLNAAALVLAALVLWWNCLSLPGWKAEMPAPLITAVQALGLSQRWKMFAPNPTKNDGWIVARGTLADGRWVDLLSADGAVSWKKPARLPELYRNYRWRKYLTQIVRKRQARHRAYFADYLCRKWNKIHPETPVQKLELFFIWEKTLPQNLHPELIRVRLGRFNCPKAA